MNRSYTSSLPNRLFVVACSGTALALVVLSYLFSVPSACTFVLKFPKVVEMVHREMTVNKIHISFSI
jgi:hypothetical protein